MRDEHVQALHPGRHPALGGDVGEDLEGVAAAEDYVSRRDRLEVLEGVPAQGGMPVRVKCLHVLVAHSLAVGPGVNPFGDEALEKLPQWWAKGPCVDPDDPDAVPGKKTR